MLVVSMTGVRLGERVAQIGCAHGGRLAAIAKKVGLSGRAVAIVPDDASAARARKGAAQAGVLVEIETAPPTRVPADDAAFRSRGRRRYRRAARQHARRRSRRHDPRSAAPAAGRAAARSSSAAARAAVSAACSRAPPPARHSMPRPRCKPTASKPCATSPNATGWCSWKGSSPARRNSRKKKCRVPRAAFGLTWHYGIARSVIHFCRGQPSCPDTSAGAQPGFTRPPAIEKFRLKSAEKSTEPLAGWSNASGQAFCLVDRRNIGAGPSSKRRLFGARDRPGGGCAGRARPRHRRSPRVRAVCGSPSHRTCGASRSSGGVDRRSTRCSQSSRRPVLEPRRRACRWCCRARCTWV